MGLFINDATQFFVLLYPALKGAGLHYNVPAHYSPLPIFSDSVCWCTRHTLSLLMVEWPGCLRFVLHNISGCIDYITASYTAYKVTSTIVTNSNVCDATMRMDDTVSENSQSSETSRTLVNPEVSQPYLSPVEKQVSDVSRFEFPIGRRRKDKLPAEKSADAALPKSHLLDVSKQTHCSKPLLKQSSLFITNCVPMERVQSDTACISGSVPETDVGQLLGSHSIPTKLFKMIYTRIAWYKAF